MAPLPGLQRDVFQDPNPPLVDSVQSPIVIPNDTLLVTTKTTNETITNVDELIDYVSGDNATFIPQLAIDSLVSDLAARELLVNKVTTIGTPGNDINYGTEKAIRDALNLKEDSLGFTPEDSANKGAISGYAGLDASQELLLVNFPSGTALQVLRRNVGNTALEFFTLTDLQGIVSINADTTAAQLIVGTTNVITVGTAAGTTTIDIDAAYVGQTSITTLGTITTGVWNGTAITGVFINAASTDLTDTAVIVRTNQANVFGAFLQNFAASSMRIPLSATPTMAVDGDFAIDTLVTDFSHGIIKYFDGEELGVVSMPIAQFVTPTDGDVIAYNATTDEFELVSTTTGITSINGDTTPAQIIAGTANNIFITDVGATHTIKIDVDYPGQNSIDTLGIITTGVWNGTDIALTNIVNGTADQIIKTNAGGTALEFGLIGDANTDTFTTTKISTTSKSLLNSAIVYNDQANVFGDFIQTFKDNSITIESPDGLTPTTLVNTQQTLARNLTIPILTANRFIVVTGEASQITLGTEVIGAITDLSDVTAKTGTGTIVVMDTTPTIVTPNIDSFVNSNHDHQTAAGGGTLNSILALADTADIAYLNTPNSFVTGMKQTVRHDVTNAGLRIVPNTGNPGTQEDGDMWINNTTDKMFAFINSEDVLLSTNITTINFIIDGGGSVITTGIKGHLVVDFDCTIIEWVIIGLPAGAIVVDVNRSTFAGFPATSSIAGTELPTIVATNDTGEDRTLTSWSTIGAGDILEFEVDSVTTIERCTVALKCMRT